MSFAGSIQMIFFSMLTCTIGSQGGPNKMAAANFLWLHFLNNRSSIQSSFLDRTHTHLMDNESKQHSLKEETSCFPFCIERDRTHCNAMEMSQ